MKIVLLIPNLHAGSELALNQLVKRDDLEIVGVVRSKISPWQKTYWKYLAYGVRRAGVFYGFVIGVFVYLHVIGLALASLFLINRRRNWLKTKTLVKKYGLDFFECKSINSQKSIEKIRSWKPDVLVTLNFDQILKKEVIEIPKVAALNVHPGILPQYKGIWPDFWKLHNGEKYAGVTIHHLNEKIDDGDIVAQTKFPIMKNENRFSLGLKSAQKGTKLLISTLLKIKSGVKMPKIKIKGKPRYYSLPTKEAFDRYFDQGKKLFSFRAMYRDFKKLF